MVEATPSGAAPAAELTAALRAAGVAGVDDSTLGRSLYASDGWMTGNIDEFRIYNSALSGAKILRSFQQGPDKPLSDGPVQFITQPQNVTVTENQPATFTADATARSTAHQQLSKIRQLYALTCNRGGCLR